MYPKPPSEYEIHSFSEPSLYKVWGLKKRRDEIIMACLRGGQHIDAAMEAADRLAPESDLKKYEAEYHEKYEAWIKKDDEIRRKQSNDIKKRTSWWPF